MSTNKAVSARTGPLSIFSGRTSTYLLRLLALALIDAIAVWLIGRMYADGVWQLATVLLVITVFINAIFLREELYPLRWMSPGIALMLLMVVYPIIFTIYIAFTNFSTGHLLTKEQAISVLGQTRFLPENAVTYEWVAYRSPAGEYVLALISDSGEVSLARPGAAITSIVEGQDGVGTLDEEGIPQTIDGYERLERRDVVPVLSDLATLEFGEAPATVVINTLSAARQSQQRYTYDPVRDALVDNQTGTVYQNDPSVGSFISAEGQELTPGYRVEIGMANFNRIFNNPALRGPFLMVFVWTFAFAILSVLISFALGLALALVFNDPNLPARKLIRTLLIIPYTIPAVISVLIWRGLFNPQFGMINDFLMQSIGIAPNWLNDPTMAKVAILIVNLWLGYPYMMLVSSGALQAIPSDVYEASAIDGATASQSFWRITLPLLLVSLGPLLISSFAFNLNNFNIIYLFNEGGPPISGSPTPAGHTDILISYTYRLAFAGGRGADYGFASAITIIIFFLVATITFFNFRYTGALEEVN
jgi:ABC-type sugar transport system permease subunit